MKNWFIVNANIQVQVFANNEKEAKDRFRNCLAYWLFGLKHSYSRVKKEDFKPDKKGNYKEGLVKIVDGKLWNFGDIRIVDKGRG